jgi:hypothetical protein
VQPPLAARLKLEMLHRIGHVDTRAIDASVDERPVQDDPGWPHEWMSSKVLTVSGLLADKHDLRVGRPLSKYRLGGILPQRARTAGRGLATQIIEVAGSCACHHVHLGPPFAPTEVEACEPQSRTATSRSIALEHFCRTGRSPVQRRSFQEVLMPDIRHSRILILAADGSNSSS